MDQLRQRFGKNASLYSQTENWANERICIVDQIGMLAYLYRYANLAFIGGGFGKGIHSIQEAFIYGIPVIFGPNYQGFREARMLVAMKGGFSISNVQALQEVWTDLQHPMHYQQAQEAIQGFIDQNIGATNKILSVIEAEFLPNRLTLSPNASKPMPGQ